MNFVQIIILVLIACVFILIFGIQYLKSMENMALIEKNLKTENPNGSSGFLFTCGIVLIGLAIGFLVGSIMDRVVGHLTNLSYIISILFFSGIAFLISYKMMASRRI